MNEMVFGRELLEEFQIKALNEILEEILKENTLIRKLKCIVPSLFEKYYINKSRVQDLIKKVQAKKSYSLHSDLIFLISRLELSKELKLDSYISIYSYFNNNFREEVYDIKYFIESFCQTNFKLKKINNPEFKCKFKKLTRILITDLFERLGDDNKYYFVPLITSLFETYYKLVKIDAAESLEFITLFNQVYNRIPLNFQNQRKWILHFDYYLTIENDLSATLDVIESFLIYYEKNWRRENHRDYYPNPVKFLEIVRKRFSKEKKQKNFTNFLLEFYQINTTNYIPSIFLEKKELNNPNILKIIENNLNYRNFDIVYLKEVYSILTNHKPDKHSFHYYCNTIAALKKQYLSMSLFRISNFKKLNLNQKFRLFVVIYKKNPEIREYPSILYKYFIRKKRYVTNLELLHNYLELIKISENYREFWDLYNNFYDYNKKSIKNIKNISQKTWLKFRKIFESLLKKSEFSNFEKLFNIFKGDLYNFYLSEDTNSLEEYIKKEFNLDSSYLFLFLYTYFINKAMENNNWDLTLKIINEFQIFKEKSNITGNSIDLFLGRDPLRKEIYEIEFNNLISLIRSGKKDEQKEFLQQSENSELKSPHKDLSKIALIKFMLGNFVESREYFQKNIDYLKRPRLFLTNKISKSIQEGVIKISKLFIILIDFEIKSTNLGSLKEVKRELSNIFIDFDNCIKAHNYIAPYIWHFPLFIVYLHYLNLYNFCFFIEKLDEDITAPNLNLYINKLYTTNFCQEWDNLKNFWKILLETGMTNENRTNLSANQYEIFIRNPLFKGIREVFKKSFPIDSLLYHIFNYKPDKLLINGNIFEEITDHLKEAGISEQETEDIQVRTWILLLNHIALLSEQSFNKKNSFQEEALFWKKEKEMHEWFDLKFRAFEKEHEFINYHSEADAGGGECEHFINDIPIEDKIVDKSDHTNIREFLKEQYENHYPQVRRYGIGKRSKYAILLITDKREEIINDAIRVSSPNKCLMFQYNKEDNLWCAVFAFQVFKKTPSQARN